MGLIFYFQKGIKKLRYISLQNELCYRVANSVGIESFAAIIRNIRKIAVEEYCVLCASNYTADLSWFDTQIQKLDNYAFEDHERKQIKKFLREFVDGMSFHAKGEICTKSTS